MLASIFMIIPLTRLDSNRFKESKLVKTKGAGPEGVLLLHA
jgi:hypothetical protein